MIIVRSSAPALDLAAVVVASMVMASCASVAEPPGTASAQFFQNPDRVWAAIGETLETLGYEVETSNRIDGVIRAVAAAGVEFPGIVLEISQVMHTGDQVNVYVKPSPAVGSTADREAANAAAGDFVSVLKRKLAG
jgi:hypothetical protein